MKKFIAYTMGFCLLIFIACHSHDENDGHVHDDGTTHAADDAHAHRDEAEAEGAADEVELTKFQMEQIGLKMGAFESKNLKSTIKVNGVLEIPPQNKADVSALIGGQISRIFVRQGQFVKKGQRLANLQNTELIDIQQQLLESKGALQFLEKEYVRQKALLEKEIAAQKSFDKIESERAIEQARVSALSAKLRLLGLSPKEDNSLIESIPIYSPISGYVRDIMVNTGMYVESNKTLFELVDNHHIHIDLKVFERDLSKLKLDQVIDFSLQSNPSKVMQAKIFAIGKALHEADRSVPVHAEITSDIDLLLPGMYVEARIISDEKPVRSLPEAAIVTDKGLDYIFIQEEEHEDEVHFKKVQILTGSRDIGYIEVNPLEELAADVSIVTNGAFFLMAQSKKNEGGGGHGHAH